MGELINMPRAASQKIFSTITGPELLTKEFPPLEFVVEDILPKGLTLLAGRPKFGKSLLITDIALCVAAGEAWNNHEVTNGDVLHLSLEDNERRLQSRIQKMSKEMNLEKLQLAIASPVLGDGFEEAVQHWYEQVENPTMVIVDTYAKIKPALGQSNGEYAAEYKVMSAFHDLATELNLAIVLVHHTRKELAEDPFDTIHGSTGLTAAVDTMIVLRGSSSGPVFQGRGRDLAEFEYALERDNETLKWKIHGTVDEARMSETRTKVSDAVSNGHTGPREIAEATGLNEAAVRQTARRMVMDNQLSKSGHGIYKVLD